MSVIEAALSSGMTVAGILDPGAGLGDTVCGYPVVGNDDDIAPLAASGRYAFVVTLGSIKSPERRIALQQAVIDAGGLLTNIVASTAYVSPFATLGLGTVVLHRAIINAGASVGAGCIVNTGAIIEHASYIGDFTHVSTGAIINGDCHIASGCFIGSGTVISSQIRINTRAVIGAGAVVIKDINEEGTYTGVPAQKKR